MNMYYITITTDEEDMEFITRAENAAKAVGKWLIAVKDTLFYEQNIILLFNKIINESVSDPDEDIFIYNSENMSIECTKGTTIAADNLQYDISESKLYTYQQLPEETKLSLTFEDVSFILQLEYDYLTEKGLITLEEPDGSEQNPILNMAELSNYILNEAMNQGRIYKTEHIDEVLESEMEYMKAVGIIEESMLKNDEVIELGRINTN
jgi:hypothetical protein